MDYVEESDDWGAEGEGDEDQRGMEDSAEGGGYVFASR